MLDIIGQFRHRPRIFVFPLIGFLLVLAMLITVVSYFPKQPAHAATPDWTTFQGGIARTGFDASETTINTTTAPNLKLHWTFSNPGHAQITAQVMAPMACFIGGIGTE